MIPALRVIDTGERPARWNVAMTAALTELHRIGRIADTIRFHRYPAAVLIGRHQAAAQAAHLDECRAAGVECARRITGGGAVYMAPGALAWDIVMARRRIGGALDNAGTAIGEAVAAGLSRLGVPARHRPPNEVEAGGRKLCGSGGCFDGGTLVYQGTVLVDADLAEMGRFLRLPASGLQAQLTHVREWLGRAPVTGEIESALAASLSDRLRRTLRREEPGTEELELAEELHRTRYGLDAFVESDPSGSEDAATAHALPAQPPARRAAGRRIGR